QREKEDKADTQHGNQGKIGRDGGTRREKPHTRFDISTVPGPRSMTTRASPKSQRTCDLIDVKDRTDLLNTRGAPKTPCAVPATSAPAVPSRYPPARCCGRRRWPDPSG